MLTKQGTNEGVFIKLVNGQLDAYFKFYSNDCTGAS